ncbi:FAD-binding oxidoreductase [Streptomyces xiaopingdaonensis]|uniref:FAD-binding oxidoreductase n=1 Tax=Streptomyces xiaopingdaonensis TaxID=1565415 RepID=UPI0002EA08AE|nr:FAD-binding oxidoreductase [Streptomyces xiaopingdaonensis]
MLDAVGPVLRPEDAGYDAERLGFNLALDDRPAVVVGAEEWRDVAAAVRYAAGSGLGVGVLATGHGVSVRTDGQLLVATRRMRRVEVDASRRVARVEPGARWQDVVEAAAEHGLAPPSGSNPGVGAVGYTLGGGIGLLGRRYGYAAEHARSFDLVTADGHRQTVDADHEPDLFWALRGGKGNFGVVTSMEIGLLPVSRLHGGGLYFGADDAERALHAYLRWVRDVPEEMTSSIQLMHHPDLPQIPEELRGRYIAHVRIAHCGAPDEGEEYTAALRGAAAPLLDTVRTMPYTEAGSIHHEPPDPMPTFDRNSALTDLTDATADALLAHCGPRSEAPYVVELRHHGGAYARPDEDGIPVTGRDAAFLLFTTSLLEPGDYRQARAEHDRLHEAAAPWATHRTFVNFLGVDDAPHTRVATAYEPDAYARLRALKAAYDPTNLFRVNYNIPPEEQPDRPDRAPAEPHPH